MNPYNICNKSNVNYYKSEETAFDEYTYCEKCVNYVYEYCSIHGPYLIIPDDKVSSKPKFPSFVPRAALTIPSVFLHLAPSRIPGAGVGVFSTLTLPRGVRFGPYRGQRTEQMCSMYCWQIYDRNNKPSHLVDSADANSSNWMRYVNCARHWCEQNLVAYQYRGQLYYRTIKTIRPFTEMLVFYGCEFASALKIDLRNYNSNNYEDIIGTPVSTTDAEIKSDEKIPVEIADDNFTPKIILTNNTKHNSQNTLANDNDVNKIIKPETWQCTYCYKVLSRKTRKSAHYSTHSIKCNLDCNLCPFKATNNLEYTKHKIRHTETDKYLCQICYFLSNNNTNLNRHVNRLHRR